MAGANPKGGRFVSLTDEQQYLGFRHGIHSQRVAGDPIVGLRCNRARAAPTRDRHDKAMLALECGATGFDRPIRLIGAAASGGADVSREFPEVRPAQCDPLTSSRAKRVRVALEALNRMLRRRDVVAQGAGE